MFKEYRIKRNLTQEQLADLTDLDNRTIQRIESGERNPSIESLKKLTKALKITDDDVLNYIKNFNQKKK